MLRTNLIYNEPDPKDEEKEEIDPENDKLG